MSIDYIVASLPALAFGAPAPMTWEQFEATTDWARACKSEAKQWADLETQLRNAVAEARGGERYKRAADGCSVFWKSRVLACFQEKDPLRRDDMIDKVWWDAAGELEKPSSPLGTGALAAYAVRLKIALRRARMSRADGSAAFDRLTAASKLTF